MNQPSDYQIPNFGTLALTADSTSIGPALTQAKNCMLRPFGAIKGILRYFRLWGIGSTESVQTTFRALPFTGYPGGVGSNSAARAANKTVAIRVWRQGKHFLLFYDLTASRARGMFYLGDDGTFTSGAYDFAAGTPSFEVMAVGLDADARWFGRRMATMLKLSNNVDDPVCVQLGRTATPGKWRKAGSNVAPAAAVISQVTPASDTNVQPFYTIPGSAGTGVEKFIADPTGDRIYTYDLFDDLTSLSAASDFIVLTSLGTSFLPVGTPVILRPHSTGAAGNLSNYTVYYIQGYGGTANSYKLSATSGGAAIDLTGSLTGTMTLYRLKSAALGTDREFQFTAGSAAFMPSGLSTGTNYYTRNGTAYSFQVSSSAGGAAINFTTQGGNPAAGATMELAPTTVYKRVGTASLTFTADPNNFPGGNGNSRIRVAITQSPYATALSSSRTGAGTLGNPYLYTITTGTAAAANSTDAIVAFVNTDPNAAGILTASKSAADATDDDNNYPAQFLANGTGAGTSEGLTNQTVTVYLRYFDTGSERIGYEGVSSVISNTILLTDTTNADILITITPDPTAEGGRFDLIRAYMQFGEGTSAVWNLVGEVLNTSGTKTIQVGSNTVIGQAMYVDQNRPLPFRDCVMVQNQVWQGGNTTTPDLMYISKPAVTDEIAPEGANLESSYIIALADQTSRAKITALFTDDFRLHVHMNQGVVILNPTNPDADRHIPQVNVGAINPECLATWERSRIYYLGADLQVYEFDGARYGKRNIASMSDAALPYVLQQADLDRVTRELDRVSAFVDDRSKMMWYSFPGDDNVIISFAFDFLAKGVMGEYEWPRFHKVCSMEPERTEKVFCDELGNLFFYDSREQKDWGDDLGTFSAPTGVNPVTPVPVQYSGYGNIVYNGLRYMQGYEAIAETGLIDLGSIRGFKCFSGAAWTTVKGARGFVEVTLTNASGQTVMRAYGDIGSTGTQQFHRIAASLGGTMVKVKVRVVSAEQIPWVIRNLSLIYRTAGQR